MSEQQVRILLIIVVAQFMCTSLWFAGNAIIVPLATALDLSPSAVGWMTSSVQLGFIIGTIFYAVFTIADRFNASNVFLFSAMLGALSNALITHPSLSYEGMLAFRFLTGFFLAGIYPVGMKIASDFFDKGLGKALSFLVGALVLGTALPHFIASFDAQLEWERVLYASSYFSMGGGLLVRFFVGEGPYKSKAQQPHFSVMMKVFSDKEFRAASFGYFGHMWELYAFWAFVPALLRANGHLSTYSQQELSFQSFVIIAIGALACFMGGFVAEKYGVKRSARMLLILSGVCCLFSPFAMEWARPVYFAFLLFWGMVVIADSPLFSTLVAQKANPELKGTALTLVTSIGFAITIVSIQLLSYLLSITDGQLVYMLLAIGPVFGVLSLRGSVATSASS